VLTQAIGVRVVEAMPAARRLRQRELLPRRDLLGALIRERLPEWRFRLPAGGLFLWAELPHGDAREYAQVAFRHGLVTLPGPTMSAGEEHAAFLRLPFVGTPETLQTAVERLATAWHTYRSQARERRPTVPVV
jgi:DNA-binding transcriptional MocR family regulator